jgi:hypothetical protein
MGLCNADGDPVDVKLKTRYFNGFIRKAKPIKASYFKSKRGFVLGDPKEKAIKIYGKPDKVSSLDSVGRYEWDFEGDIDNESKTRSKRKRLAEDSFGYHVIIFCRNNKIIGIILHNDVP